MPIEILNLQQQLRKIGEIHIGELVKLDGTDRNGKQKTRPGKLKQFRFTSRSRSLLEKVGALYGGEPKPWTPANDGPSGFELYSNADEVPVLIRRNAVEQWFELYEGRRCVRKCDGTKEKLRGRPCMCDPDGALGWFDDRECDPYTRLRVMLRDLAAIGEWQLTSKGRNAAVEIPPLARIVAAADGYVSARLSMEPREVFPLTGPSYKFMVPILHVDVTPLELLSGGGSVAARGGGQPAIGPGGRKALEAAPMARVDPGPEFWKAQADSAPTVDALTAVLFRAQAVGRAQGGDDLYRHFLTRREALEQAAVEAEAAAQAAAEAGDDIEDAEVLDDGSDTPDPWAATAATAQSEAGSTDEDAVWFQIVANAPWGTTELAVRFEEFVGCPPAAASVEQLRAYLAHLQKQAAT